MTLNRSNSTVATTRGSPTASQAAHALGAGPMNNPVQEGVPAASPLLAQPVTADAGLTVAATIDSASGKAKATAPLLERVRRTVVRRAVVVTLCTVVTTAISGAVAYDQIYNKPRREAQQKQRESDEKARREAEAAAKAEQASKLHIEPLETRVKQNRITMYFRTRLNLPVKGWTVVVLGRGNAAGDPVTAITDAVGTCSVEDSCAGSVLEVCDEKGVCRGRIDLNSATDVIVHVS